MDITLPSVNFTMQRIFPFRKKITEWAKNAGTKKFRSPILRDCDNSFRTVDTPVVYQKTLDNARMGIQHQASSDYTFKLFKYINVSPNIRYEENWYPYTIKKELNDKITEVFDTTYDDGDGSILATTLNETKSTYGEVVTSRDWNFHTFRKYDVGISTNTALFFTKQVQKRLVPGYPAQNDPIGQHRLWPGFHQTARPVFQNLLH